MNIFCFICGLLGHTEKQCLKLYDCPSGEVVKAYGHRMKAPNKRSQMNSDERWLRSEMPNEFNNGKGNNVNFAGMAIDSVISTNPEDHVLKIRDYSVNAGIAGINKESSILLPNRSHFVSMTSQQWESLMICAGVRILKRNKKLALLLMIQREDDLKLGIVALWALMMSHLLK